MPVSLASPVPLTPSVLPVLTGSSRVVLIARDSMDRVVSAVMDASTLSRFRMGHDRDKSLQPWSRPVVPRTAQAI